MAWVDHNRVTEVAKHLTTLKDMPPLDFYHDFNGDYDVKMYPTLNHPETINYFFFLGMQNYGYWTATEQGYEKPIFGEMYGKKDAKGSDLLWQIAKRTFDKDEQFFRPQRLANLSMRRFIENLFTDDIQVLPFRDLPRRYELTRDYADWFVDNDTTPAQIVREANQDKNPLAYFRQVVECIPGYDQDPLEKKNVLLAMSLANRPEHFLQVAEDDPAWTPIIDYHIMRLALRTGMVKIPAEEQSTNTTRSWTTNEWEIRKAAYNAVGEVIQRSGKTMGEVDNLFWSARRYCPEMESPQCDKCSIAPACEKNTQYFQPVIDTTFY